MSPVRFPSRPTPSEAGDATYDTSCLIQRPLSASQETSGYPIPKTESHGGPPHSVDLHTLNYSLNRSMQRAQDFTGWSVRPDGSFPYSYGTPDYGFSMTNPQGADDDPFAPRTTYPCDPRIIFNQNLDELPYEYSADLLRQDQYTLFSNGDTHEPHHFSRLSISHSPAPDHDYTLSQASSRYPSPSIHGIYHNTPNGGHDEDGNGHGHEALEKPEPDEVGTDEPYAKLIYRALLNAPNHAMVLKDIYKWFEEHTDKAESPSKGWQNSIRHNLSMNGAFKKHEREPTTEDGKKYCEWVLEPSAIAEGVKSTTRYRKPTNHKNRHRSDPPAPIRQYSGRLGGQANRQQSQKRKWMEREHRDGVLGQGGRSERWVGRLGGGVGAGGRAYSPGLNRGVVGQGQGQHGLYHPQPQHQHHPFMSTTNPFTTPMETKPQLSMLNQNQYPPTPKPDFDSPTPVPMAGGTSPMSFYYPTPASMGNTPGASSRDLGGGNGMGGAAGGGSGLYAVDEEDIHVFDGLPTPDECVAALGECVGVCDGESPVFVDDEDVDAEEVGEKGECVGVVAGICDEGGSGGGGGVVAGDGSGGEGRVKRVGGGEGGVGEGKGPEHCPRMWDDWQYFEDE